MKKLHPERDTQNAILEYLKWQKDCVVMEIDTQGIMLRNKQGRPTFLKKKPNQGSLFFRGVADILVFHKHKGFIAIEVKSKVGILSDVQKQYRDAILACGGIHILARSVSDVAQIFTLLTNKT